MELGLKITGCVLILLSTTGIGNLLAMEIKKRIDELKSAKTVALLLKGDIRYAHTALPEALDNVSRRHDGKLAVFLKEVSKGLKEYNGKSFSAVWKEAMDKELKNSALTKKDKASLLEFGEQLGYLDKDMQLNHIDWYISQVDEEVEEVTKDAKDKIRLYRSLGVLFGILIAILIV